jgi:hypothetical protein
MKIKRKYFFLETKKMFKNFDFECKYLVNYKYKTFEFKLFPFRFQNDLLVIRI